MDASVKDIRAAVSAMGDAPQHVFETALNEERATQNRKAAITLLNTRIRKAAKACRTSRYGDTMCVKVEVNNDVVVVLQAWQIEYGCECQGHTSSSECHGRRSTARV